MAQARQRKYEQALESFLKENDEAHARNLLGVAAMEGGDLDTAQNEFMLALSASPRFFPAAQDNLEQVARQISERRAPAPALANEDAPVTTASTHPAAAAPVAGLASWSTDRYSGQAGNGGNRRKQAGSDPLSGARVKPCIGAEALKPRCNPYAAKQRSKSRRVAAYKPPKP
jgi:hypothetical protein